MVKDLTLEPSTNTHATNTFEMYSARALGALLHILVFFLFKWTKSTVFHVDNVYEYDAFFLDLPRCQPDTIDVDRPKHSVKTTSNHIVRLQIQPSGHNRVGAISVATFDRPETATRLLMQQEASSCLECYVRVKVAPGCISQASKDIYFKIMRDMQRDVMCHALTLVRAIARRKAGAKGLHVSWWHAERTHADARTRLRVPHLRAAQTSLTTSALLCSLDPTCNTLYKIGGGEIMCPVEVRVA
eukprot:3753689-Pleurochrysis_carterae.AAC.2